MICTLKTTKLAGRHGHRHQEVERHLCPWARRQRCRDVSTARSDLRGQCNPITISFFVEIGKSILKFVESQRTPNSQNYLKKQ